MKYIEVAQEVIQGCNEWLSIDVSLCVSNVLYSRNVWQGEAW